MYALRSQQNYLEINNRKSNRKSQNARKIKNTLINNTLIKEETRRETNKYFGLNENENNLPKFMGYSENSTWREIYSIKCIYQRKKKIQITNIRNKREDIATLLWTLKG